MICATDVSYEPSAIPSLLQTLREQLAPGGVCYLGHTDRNSDLTASVLLQMVKSGFHVQVVHIGELYALASKLAGGEDKLVEMLASNGATMYARKVLLFVVTLAACGEGELVGFDVSGFPSLSAVGPRRRPPCGCLVGLPEDDGC
mmetsp:Transcript_40039/g.89950  ORF Transcript_40039/g.89950 Transcript_40039/m.89950 type:complete len:145 (+) Transcript_40039:681-1115(+)